MNASQHSNVRPYILLLSGVILVITASLWQSFSILVFIAFASFFAFTDILWPPAKIYFVLIVALVGVLSELVLHTFEINTPVLLYIFLVAGLLASYASVQRLTQNRLNKFTLVILFVGLEYLLLKFMIHTNPVFLADILNHKSDWIRWNYATGYLGVSLWILSTNLIFYQALFKSGKVNLFYSLLGVLTIVLPILYSQNLQTNGVTKEEMINFYSGNPVHAEHTYGLHGELISRTGAWVSILIIIFTLIRIKTKKVAR